MSEIASQITSLTIVYSTVHSGADQSKHQSSASLAFVWEIHRWPVNFPHKWPVTRKIFPFDDVIMAYRNMSLVLLQWYWCHGGSNHRRLDFLLDRLCGHISKKTSKVRVTGLCKGNPQVTGGFPSQMASNAEMFPFDDVIMTIIVVDADFQNEQNFIEWTVINCEKGYFNKQRVLMLWGEMPCTVCVTFTWDMYIYIYIWVVYSFCLFCCLFIIVTWWYMWCIVWQVAIQRKYRHVW